MAQARSVRPVVAWMTGALACFVCAAVAVRELSRWADPFQIGLARTAVGLLLLLASAGLRPALRRQATAADPLLHTLRNAVHATGGVLWTIAIAALPFATVFSLEFTAPAWVAILAYPLLGERVRRRAVAGIAACTLGVVVILRPGFAAWDPHLLAALAAALCFAVSVILTRKLALKQSTFSILLWMMALQSAFYAGAIALAGGSLPSAATGGALMAVPVLGVAGLGSQLCLARALGCGEAAVVMPMDFLRVPLIALVGSSFYGEVLSLWVLGGAALIMAGICYGLRTPPSLPRPAAPTGAVQGRSAARFEPSGAPLPGAAPGR